jgi:hypothetical protein
MTKRFDAYVNVILEKLSPEQHTEKIMMQYGAKLKNLKNKLMDSETYGKQYQGFLQAFSNISQEYMRFYDKRQGEIEEDAALCAIHEVISQMIQNNPI